MKTRILSLFALLCLIAGTSCAQKPRLTPLEYNDKLAAITDSLYSLGTEWGTEFQKIAGSDKDYSKLATQRKKLLAFTLRKINEVRNGPTSGKGAEDLKAAMLGFLNFEKEMVDKAFTPIEKLTSSTPQSEVDQAITRLTSLAEQEGDVLKKVNAAQETFGQKNGFTLEKADRDEE